MIGFLENELEQAAKEWFGNIGYETIAGADLSPGGELCDRIDYQSVLLQERLTAIIRKFNPTLNDSQVKDVYNAVARPNNANLMINNKNFHKYLVNGVDYVVRLKNGETKTEKARLIDFDNPIDNDFVVVGQMTIIENGRERRPDLIVYLNGMPIVVIELKNTANDKVGIMKGFNQLQTYKKELTNLFVYNEFLITSDGLNAKVGTMTSDFDRYMFWRTVDGNNENNILPQLQVMIMGMFDKNRLLELLQNYILFQDDGTNIHKILAGYHQYNAVTKAVLKTLVASSENGNHKAGVVWHTQGSGKSLSMVFFTGLLVKKMNNPTVVVLTDRNDLDDQLFDTFAKSAEFLRQVPVQAESRKNLRDLLSVNAGGIVFTTIQKFSPDNTDTNIEALTKRSNVIVIADEAHRSQYGLTAKEIHGEISYGFAKYMRDALPNASFIGFTGTPIELSDKNTPALFGDYIDIYDISKSVKDNTTVPIYYENRLAKVNFNEAEKENIDIEYEDIVYEQEENYAEAQKRKWARLEAIVGTDSRVGLIARDFVKHFEERQKAMTGKALFVAMSRRIAVKFYDEVIKLRPSWHSDDINKGAIKIVMTSDASDDANIQKHSTTKEQRKMLAKRMKNPDDELKIVIVRDMWLTGFDAPCLTTMYVDKPMSGHNLMQAIARVNRVFKDKPGGLVVDYIGIADSLKDALANFTKADRDVAGVDPQVALDLLEEKYDQIKEILSDFDYSDYKTGTPGQRVGCIVKCVDYIIGLGEEKKKNFLNYVVEISKAFALCATADEAESYNIDISFFKAVKSGIIKLLPAGGKKKTQEEVEFEIAQLVSKSVISDEVVDIMEAVGLNKPEISILSDDFLAEVQGLPQKNIAMELLKKLLANKIKIVMRRNLVQARKFSEMLEGTIALYQLRSIDTVQVIAELISYAKEMNKLPNRAEELGLSEDEVAFYDAISKNESAQEFMQDDVLKEIARELTKIIKNSTKLVDWEQREQVRAQMRVTIKRLLKKYKYPPDQQANAVKIIIEQAEEMCKVELED